MVKSHKQKREFSSIRCGRRQFQQRRRDIETNGKMLCSLFILFFFLFCIYFYSNDQNYNPELFTILWFVCFPLLFVTFFGGCSVICHRTQLNRNLNEITFIPELKENTKWWIYSQKLVINGCQSISEWIIKWINKWTNY